MHFNELVTLLPTVHRLNQTPLGTPGSSEYQNKILDIFQKLIDSDKKKLILNNSQSLYDILLIAILQNDEEYIKNLYSTFPDAINTAIENKSNAKNYYSPLILAIENNSIGIVDLLLSKGVHDFTEKHHGMNALMTALSLHYLEIAKLLLNYGANPEDITYSNTNPRSKIINQTMQDNLQEINKQIIRETSMSPNPIRNPSPVPIITDITDKSLADLFVKVYLKKYELYELAENKSFKTNFTNQIQTCINVSHPDINQQKPLMKKIIKTLRTSDDTEIFKLHTTPNTKFQAKFIALFKSDLQPEPPRIRTGRT